MFKKTKLQKGLPIVSSFLDRPDIYPTVLFQALVNLSSKLNDPRAVNGFVLNEKQGVIENLYSNHAITNKKDTFIFFLQFAEAISFSTDKIQGMYPWDNLKSKQCQNFLKNLLNSIKELKDLQ